MPRYWFLDWLEENGFTSLEGVATFLPKYRVMDVLRQRAADAKDKEVIGSAPSQPSIVAGMGLDLAAGGIVCPSPSCLRGQVDKLMRHVWHYFDTVVVDDVLTSLLTDEYTGTRAELIQDVLQQVPPLLYIQTIGAAELVDFRQKVRCLEHVEENAKVEGIGGLFAQRERLLSRLAERSTASRVKHSNRELYQIEFVDSRIGTYIPADGISERQAKHNAVSFALSEYLINVVADVSASHRYHLPLGSAEAFEGEMLGMGCQTSAEQAIFQIDLPVLEKVPTAELIRIRRDHADIFDRFRTALRVATAERLKQAPGETGAKVADEIRRDVLEPKLNEIRATLKSAERVLLKKSSVGVFLGALATTCGLLSGVLPAVAVSAGVGAVLGAVGAASSKYIETRAEVSLQDMYFLWKAVGHDHGQ